MKKIFTIISQLFCILTLLSAVEQKPFAVKYQETLEEWINNEIDLEQMTDILLELEEGLGSQYLIHEELHEKARISFLRGQIYYELGDKKRSIRELENCLSIAAEANGRKEVSEILSTMAQANSLLMMQKGFLFITANFRVPQEQAERALTLDSDNVRASLVIAQFLCNAPPIVGGKLDVGIEMLADLSGRPDLSDVDRFYILQSLTEVCRDNNRKREAIAACRRALKLFPGNGKCRALLSALIK